MPSNDTPINEFQKLLMHNLGLHEKHRFKTDTFESEEINDLYRAFVEYRNNPTDEKLSMVKSTLNVCESYKKELPYQQLNNLIEQMGNRRTPRNNKLS